MPMNFDTRFLIAKLQAAQGVAADYDGADLIPALELTHRPLEADRQSRDLVDGVPGTSAGDFLSRPRVRVTAAVEASAATTLGSAPFWADLAMACGLEEVLTLATSALYRPRSDAGSDRATLVGGFGGSQAAPGAASDFLQEAVDAVGTIGFQARDGEIPRLNFEMTALYGAPVARSAIAALSPLDVGTLNRTGYREADPVSHANSTFTFATQPLILRELTLQDETPVIHNDRPNDLSTRRGRRRYTGRMVVTAPDLADFDYFARSLDGTTGVLIFRNGGAGNQFRLIGNKVQTFLTDLGEQDNEVTATFDLLYLPGTDGSEFRMRVR